MNITVLKVAFEKWAVIHIENQCYFIKQLLGLQIISKNTMINSSVKKLWSACNNATKRILCKI